jgi:hypothetical protein
LCSIDGFLDGATTGTRRSSPVLVFCEDLFPDVTGAALPAASIGASSDLMIANDTQGDLSLS